MVDKRGIAVGAASCVGANCVAAGCVATGCVAAIAIGMLMSRPAADMLMNGPAADGMLVRGGPETLGVS